MLDGQSLGVDSVSQAGSSVTGYCESQVSCFVWLAVCLSVYLAAAGGRDMHV